MHIEIKNRWTSQIIISGDYKSIKECLEKNRGSDLRYSDLSYSDLSYSNLSGSDLSCSDLRYSNLSYSDLSCSNLRYGNLSYGNLSYSDLRYSDLIGSNLSCSDLIGSKNYRELHDIFQEVVRRQAVSVFLDTEWSAIAQITIKRLCWNAIKKRFSDVMPHIFEVLAEAGFAEWQEYWKEINK